VGRDKQLNSLKIRQHPEPFCASSLKDMHKIVSDSLCMRYIDFFFNLVRSRHQTGSATGTPAISSTKGSLVIKVKEVTNIFLRVIFTDPHSGTVCFFSFLRVDSSELQGRLNLPFEMALI
jgi:hypothetical protein